jgi:uncharacterized lipoprotein YajG
MKRTKNINRAAFRKSWRFAPVAIAVSAVFMLAGCEKTDETVSLYQNADDCSNANPSMSAQCKESYQNALKEAEKTAQNTHRVKTVLLSLAKASVLRHPLRQVWLLALTAKLRLSHNRAAASGCL